MKEFIDKTGEKDGTPINRGNLMAAQGFVGGNISFNSDGILITHDNGEVVKMTTYNNGCYIELMGEKTIRKTSTFTTNGIVEELE